MELEFLGTGAGSPAKSRNVSSVALKLLEEINEIWLFDVGEGTQHQILRTTIKPRKISKIFITHLHGDHLFGLPGFLSSRSFQGAQKNEPLVIFGPRGIADFVKTSMRVSQSKLSYPIKFVELTQDGLIFENSRFRVYAAHLNHRIECFGYRIEEKDYPGELLVDKLIAAQVPSGPLYGQLKAGKKVTLADGRVLDGRDYLGETRKGRIIAILGDTRQTPAIAKLAQNADVLVHESTFGRGEAHLAHDYYHSTCMEAAQCALRCQVKQLFLTHISARYVGIQALQLAKDASKVFPKTKVVKDFDVFTVPFPTRKRGVHS
ncbi:MAG: ribonuclease Z [Liquorilactobacillus nagelii]|uniref:Ribonuclease Z n=1 Tax=Liquorilactobacillus nagelii TaxID=82688 RepID=A0A3S6QWM7_9LACO|nr:ribonuclease Z [Liquorilactobacillus nagelii]AUJ32400.1 ribonuclease Z [Liquorilactobacillus nagelii]MCC7615584.1 ribonuclease Z [Liquorilactobacillus nagelii]MCI1634416.1 ribonuclease Z [Liquorilactobacillus nagelii]MCI1920328.1 ribonuclease Z [Liquorilactobacillus nagelii]MCI1975972.1 ribonuclease Z [Liquorilactobacillus nagelii]